VPVKTPVPQIQRVFCFFFSKKKSLPHRIELTDRTVIGHTGWYKTQRITIVIPTCDEAAHLPSLLAALTAAPDLVAAIIVSDGGSTDRTQHLARAAGAVLIEGAPGRGGQLQRGIAAARTDWMLLLHADSALPPDWAATIRHHLTDPTRAWYGRLRFASADPRAQLLEAMVRLRCTLFSLPYGDQGMLIHRDLLSAIGGMPALPLMEDVALARRLGRRRLAPMNLVVTTDASAYVRDGWVRRSTTNLLRLLRYLAAPGPVGDYRR
jgi:rSAM/selenodomain-associated transferase 2